MEKRKGEREKAKGYYDGGGKSVAESYSSFRRMPESRPLSLLK
ncbi:MAG: hypothetical protein QNL05_13520 [Gammaproteobacteria bacterium]|nr:hypothetical protein [Gammaproteobacteria bacterium]MDX2488528.1 hypothetical protein [Gammaproteobacteria bacterium]